jgi:hypothetical protein
LVLGAEYEGVEMSREFAFGSTDIFGMDVSRLSEMFLKQTLNFPGAVVLVQPIDAKLP